MKKLLLSALCLTLSLSVLFLISGCGNAKPERHTHSFTKEVVADEYKTSDATCDKKAEYYYSCECGEKGEETFAYGSPLGHEFTDYVSDNNATYEKDGTKTAHCDRKGCTATDTIPDENSKLESKMTFNTLAVGEKNADGNVSVYGKVPNAQKTYSLIDEIKIEGVVRFVVSTDVYGMHTVVTKTIPLSEGDNKIFVIELNGEDVKSIYEVTIRRRPMYSVVFDTNGGTKLDSRQIEEGTVITAPETTKAGYTFIEWDYDFTQPITRNTTIKATWSANTNTPYKVEYYKENIEDDNYTLCETSDLQGTSGASASAEQKAYEHFTFDENESVSSGAIAGDGSLILKMYYKRNVYAISNANSAYGEITNATTKKYGSPIKGLATEYLGCEFIGWFNGETLLSSAKQYDFTVECDVYAKFKAKDQMSDFNFKSSTTTCEITALKDKNATSVIIPDCVTSIWEKAFYNCDKLTSVTIGNGVTSIGKSAFGNCNGLTSVTIPDSVTSIGSDAFQFCGRLTSVTIGKSVTSIGYRAFYCCSGLTSVTIPNSVTSIGDYAFYFCSGLTSITIPVGVTSIGDYAFYFCSGLTSITIPNSVTSIGGDAFRDCSGLTSITIGNSVTSIGSQAFSGCSGLTSITIGNGVTSIGDSAFSGCSSLTSITIPDSVTSIGEYAFNDCSGLTNIYITDLTAWCNISGLVNLMQYGSSTKNFYLNNDLVTNLTIPDSVTSIVRYAFYNCSGLTSITILDSVTSIGDSAFSSCRGLTSVTIGNGVTSIGDGAFDDCSSLTSITIPDSVTSIGRYAFNGCNSLTSVTIPDSVTTIGEYAFNGCSGLTSVTIGNGVTSIGYSAFNGCSGLTSITIPNSVTSIGSWAFSDCSSLTSVTIPDGVTSIGNYTFYGCSKFTSITIPDGVTSIGDCAFYGCSGLTSITFNGTKEQWRAIILVANWHDGVPANVVHCTDGDINIE